MLSQCIELPDRDWSEQCEQMGWKCDRCGATPTQAEMFMFMKHRLCRDCVYLKESERKT